MDTSRRTAGLGLLTFGLGTLIAFLAIGSPGGEYSNAGVTSYIASGHAALAFASAYLGCVAALGLLVFGRRMRSEVRSSGDLLWGLCVAGTATAVTGWFIVGGVAVSFAEGGSGLAAVPHPVVYLLTEIGNLIAGGATAFLVGVAALILGARSSMPLGLRVFSYVGGVAGILAAFYFPLPIYFLWAIVVGGWLIATGARDAEPAPREVQPA